MRFGCLHPCALYSTVHSCTVPNVQLQRWVPRREDGIARCSSTNASMNRSAAALLLGPRSRLASERLPTHRATTRALSRHPLPRWAEVELGDVTEQRDSRATTTRRLEPEHSDSQLGAEYESHCREFGSRATRFSSHLSSAASGRSIRMDSSQTHNCDTADLSPNTKRCTEENAYASDRFSDNTSCASQF